MSEIVLNTAALPLDEEPKEEIEKTAQYLLAEAVLEDYKSRSHESVELKPHKDAAKCFNDFVNGRVHDSADAAALLIDLFDRLNDDVNNKNVMRTLMKLEQEDTAILVDGKYTHNQYMQAIAHDIPVINDFITRQIETWRKALAHTGSPEDNELQQALDSPKDHIPPSRVWLSDEMPPDKNGLAELLSEVHLESVLIKAAQTLSILRDEERLDKMSSAQKLRLIAAAEAVFVPVSQLPVYDVLATALLSETYKLRYKMAGREDLLDRAHAAIKNAGTPEVAATELPNIIRDLCSNDFFTTPVIRNGIEKYNVLFEHGLVRIDGADEQAAMHENLENEVAGSDDRTIFEIKARQKSEGAIARKLRLYERNPYIYPPESLPADMAGLTIYVKDPADVGRVLAQVYDNIQSHASASLSAAPGRQQSLHIKGKEGYRSHVAASLTAKGVEQSTIDQKGSENNFQYAKVTLTWSYIGRDGARYRLPLEIQVMDEAAKHAARHGEEESHIAHKARRYEETSDGAADEEPTTVLDEADEALEGILTDVSTQTKEQPQGPLHKIYLRKARTSPHKLTINGQSLRRAEQKTQEFRDIEERRLAAATVRSAWRT